MTSITKALNKLRGNAVEETPLEKFGEIDLVKLSSFTFKKGKVADKTFLEVMKNNPSYMKWVMKYDADERSTIALFKRFVRRMLDLCDDDVEKLFC